MMRDSDMLPPQRQGAGVSALVNSIRSGVAHLFASWRAELVSLSHELSERYARDRKSMLWLRFENTDVSIAKAPQGANSGAADFQHLNDADGDIASALRRASDAADASSDVTLVLPRSAVLRADVAMPKTSRRNLVQALRYELARLSPLPPEALYFDFFRADSAAKQTSVSLRIVKRSDVDGAAALCRQAGLCVAAIRFEEDARPADWRMFPVDKPAFVRTLWRRFHLPVLACLALVLVLTFLVAVYERHVTIGAALAEQVQEAQNRAALVRHFESRAQSAIDESRYLQAQKQGPMLVSVLAELSRVLPDNTWITQLSVDGTKLRMDGYSKAAAELIGALDRSGTFANAQFAAPLTQDPRSNVERFDLTADIRANRR